MWLAANAAVEEQGGKIHLSPGRTTGVFKLDYVDAASVAEAIQACQSFTWPSGGCGQRTELAPRSWAP